MGSTSLVRRLGVCPGALMYLQRTTWRGAVELVTLPDDRHQRLSDPARAARLRGASQVPPRQRMRGAQRLEKAHDAASVALGAVSSYLETDVDLPVFFGHLCETIAGLVGARRAAFWRLGPNG